MIVHSSCNYARKNYFKNFTRPPCDYTKKNVIAITCYNVFRFCRIVFPGWSKIDTKSMKEVVADSIMLRILENILASMALANLEVGGLWGLEHPFNF